MKWLAFQPGTFPEKKFAERIFDIWALSVSLFERYTEFIMQGIYRNQYGFMAMGWHETPNFCSALYALGLSAQSYKAV